MTLGVTMVTASMPSGRAASRPAPCRDNPYTYDPARCRSRVADALRAFRIGGERTGDQRVAIVEPRRHAMGFADEAADAAADHAPADPPRDAHASVIPFKSCSIESASSTKSRSSGFLEAEPLVEPRRAIIGVIDLELDEVGALLRPRRAASSSSAWPMPLRRAPPSTKRSTT